jgi:signal transduction histidine kinase/CheY-like chemotaxis protein
MQRPPLIASSGHSLRRRLLTIVMAATIAAMSVSGVALLIYEIDNYRRDGISDLRSQAGLLAQSLAPALVFDDAKAAHAALASLQDRPQILAAAVYSPQGVLFASYRADDAQAVVLPQRPGTGAARFSGTELALFHRIEQGGEHIGTIYLLAQFDLSSRIGSYLLIVGLAAIAGLAFAALTFRRLHPSVTRPILAMAEAARRVADERNYEIRVHEKADGEVGMLVEAFNSMVHDLAIEMRERHSAEEALRAADRRKDVFLATLAHELRNPLAPISNALTILDRAELGSELHGKARGIIARQLAQMVRLIDDLLEVSRISRGTLALRRELVDVVGVAKAALEAAEPVLRSRSHSVEVKYPDGPVWAMVDAARLMQVIVNLLNNAAKYTPAGGQVWLSVETEGQQALITVRDDGIGIAPENQQTVFDMFFQVDQSLERGAAGLGVGLTIAQQIIALHEGSLQLHSDGRGRGARFTVRLPLAPAPAARSSGPAEAPAPRGEGRGIAVLVADDNVDYADSLGEVLRAEGHAVTVVHDGPSALRSIERDWPEVAFLDIGMPGLNGLEVAARIRRMTGPRRMLLVAVTGWGQEADRQRVYEAGFDHHWVKPFELQRAVDLLQGLRVAEAGPPN